MADAWAKGVSNFDLADRLRGHPEKFPRRHVAALAAGTQGSLDDFFADHGYMPALHPGEKETVPPVHPRERRQAVSVTLAHSYDDWCVAQLARVLGNRTMSSFS